MFKTSVRYGITIEPEWVSREDYQLADELSTVEDHDDWIINSAIFAWLDSLWLTLLIDLPIATIGKSRDLTADFGILRQRQWMHSSELGRGEQLVVCASERSTTACQNLSQQRDAGHSSMEVCSILCPDGENYEESLLLENSEGLIVPGSLGATLP